MLLKRRKCKLERIKINLFILCSAASSGNYEMEVKEEDPMGMTPDNRRGKCRRRRRFLYCTSCSILY